MSDQSVLRSESGAEAVDATVATPVSGIRLGIDADQRNLLLTVEAGSGDPQVLEVSRQLAGQLWEHLPFYLAEMAGTTRRDVVMAYRLMLGREPENNDVVEALYRQVQNWQELRDAFVNAPEFEARNGKTAPTVGMALTWPRIRVDVDVTSEMLATMIAHVDATWSLLGREQPHWSVVTADQYLPAEIAGNLAGFYDSGKEARLFMARALERCGIDPSRYRDCLELGCGVGRITVWLAEIFPRVIATDVSAPHLELAKEAVARYERSNVDFRLLRDVAQFEDLPDFDAVVSIIVLQHNPPPLMAYMLRQLLSKLRPGGFAYFQVPTYYHGYSFIAEKYIKNINLSGRMEMHCLPQQVVFEIAKECGCDVREVREDGWTGSNQTVSNSFLVVKQGTLWQPQAVEAAIEADSPPEVDHLVDEVSA